MYFRALTGINGALTELTGIRQTLTELTELTSRQFRGHRGSFAGEAQTLWIYKVLAPRGSFAGTGETART